MDEMVKTDAQAQRYVPIFYLVHDFGRPLRLLLSRAAEPISLEQWPDLELLLVPHVIVPIYVSLQPRPHIVYAGQVVYHEAAA